MEPIYWQIAVVVSIALAFRWHKSITQIIARILPSASPKRNRIQTLSATQIGAGALALWMLWSAANLNGPLLIVQCSIAIGAFLVLRHREQMRRITNEQQETINNLIQNIQSNYNFSTQACPTQRTIFSPRDHRRLLLSTIQTASEEIIIVSGWASLRALNAELRKQLLDALRRGVDVYIAFGYASFEGKTKDGNTHERGAQIFRKMRIYAERKNLGGRLYVEVLTSNNIGTHQKVLIQDRRVVTIGSYNWLSNPGSGRNNEASISIEDAELSKQISTEIFTYFDFSKPSAPSGRSTWRLFANQLKHHRITSI